MGYLYRPKLKGKAPDFESTPGDLALSRGENGNGQGFDDGKCHHPAHGTADVRPGCGARFSKTWWAKYNVNGKAIRESTETEKETEAKRFLKDREGSAVKGHPIVPPVERILHEEAAEDLRTHYKTTNERDLTEAGWRPDAPRGFLPNQADRWDRPGRRETLHRRSAGRGRVEWDH